MFNIYIRNYYDADENAIHEGETLLQTIPETQNNKLKLISPTIKVEMGKAENLDFSIEVGTSFYDAFLQMKTYVRVTYDGTTIFYGRVLTIDNNNFKGTRKIRCEGPMSFLLDSPVEGVEETKRKSISIHDYMAELISNHNTYVGNDPNKKYALGEVPGNYSDGVSAAQKIENVDHKYGSDSWTDTKSALEDLRSHYGGYFRTRTVVSGSNTTTYLDWMNHYFNKTVNSQMIEVGKNVIDISSVTEIDNVFTAIIPIGKGTVEKKNGTTGSSTTALYINGYEATPISNNAASVSTSNKITYSGKVLQIPEILKYYTSAQLNAGYHSEDDYEQAIDKYGIIVKTVSFPDASTKEKLFTEACKWIKNNYQGEVTKFTIKAIDMHQIGDNAQKILVGDRVVIKYPVGDENGDIIRKTTTQTCLDITYDLYRPENNSYTFGIPANALTKMYGVKKAGKSVNNGKYTPPPNEPPDPTPEDKALAKASEWLGHHGCRYIGPKPYKNSYGIYGIDPGQPTGPNDSVMYRTTDPTGGGNPLDFDNIWLLRATRIKNHITEGPNGEIIAVAYDEKEKIFAKDRATETQWTGALVKYTDATLTLDMIIRNHIPEYVEYVYGENFWVLIGTSAPIVVSTPEGTKINIEIPEEDAQEVGKTIAQMILDGSSNVVAGFLGPDGETIYSYMDPTGNWTYYYKDDNNQWHETNIRDLQITSIDNERKVGWIVNDVNYSDGTWPEWKANKEYKVWDKVKRTVSGEATGYTCIEDNKDATFDPDKWRAVEDAMGFNPNRIGELSLEIEEFKGGPLVVATFAGELMYIGNKNTQMKTSVTLSHMDEVCGDFEYTHVDPSDPTSPKIVTIKDAAGFRLRHAEKKLKDGGDPNNPDDYVYVYKDDPDHPGQQIISYGDFGVYDDNTLVGGIIAKKLNDNTVNTKIRGDIVDIEAGTIRIGNCTNISHYSSMSKFPASGQAGRAYADDSTGKVYSWDSTTNSYVELPETDFMSWAANRNGLIADKASIGQLEALEANIASLWADKIDAENINVALGKVSTLYAREIDLTSYGTGGSIFAKRIYAANDISFYNNQTEDIWSIKNFITDVKLEDPSQTGISNTYRISQKSLADVDYREIGTFSRAVSGWGELSWDATNGKIEITVQPQNQTHSYIPPTLRIYGATSANQPPTVDCTVAYGKWNSNSWTDWDHKYIYLVREGSKSTSSVGIYETSSPGSTTSPHARISVGDLYREGQNDAVITNWGELSWDATNSKIKVTLQPNSQTHSYTPPDLRIYGATSAGQAPTADCTIAYGTGSSNSWTKWKDKYIYLVREGSKSTSSVGIYETSSPGSTTSPHASISVGDLYREGLNDAVITNWGELSWDATNSKIKVTLQPNSQTHSYTPPTLRIYGATSAGQSPTVDCTVAYGKATNNSWADWEHKYIYLVRQGSKSSSSVGIFETSTPGSTTSPHASISVGDLYTSGWNEAYNKIEWPEPTTPTESMTIKVPKSTAGSSGQDEKTYTLSVSNTSVQIKCGDTVTARTDNTAYTYNLPAGITLATFEHVTNPPTGSETTPVQIISTLESESFWTKSTFANKSGYCKFRVSAHGKTKVYYFAYNNKKNATDGNPAYVEGYNAGYVADLPSDITFGTIENAGQNNQPSGTHITALDTNTFWTNFSNTYGYARCKVTVHGKSKYFWFSFDNRKNVPAASGGNQAYKDGYTDGLSAGSSSSSISQSDVSIVSNTLAMIAQQAGDSQVSGYKRLGVIARPTTDSYLRFTLKIKSSNVKCYIKLGGT